MSFSLDTIQYNLLAKTLGRKEGAKNPIRKYDLVYMDAYYYPDETELYDWDLALRCISTLLDQMPGVNILVVGRQVPAEVYEKVDVLDGLDEIWCLTHAKVLMTTA